MATFLAFLQDRQTDKKTKCFAAGKLTTGCFVQVIDKSRPGALTIFY